jgi:5-aminopentanamidase
MKVAAYQAPLLEAGSMDALDLIRTRVGWCEAERVDILCCPEAILGGLADYSRDPRQFAISATTGRLDTLLAPIASDTVTTILGFTELSDGGALYNTAALFHRGMVVGLYRKLHPAINRSVYEPAHEVPVFRVGGLTFGILICNDSNDSELARSIAARGATAVFVPTNNALPLARAHATVVEEARNVDTATAVENRLWVVRADVAGRTDLWLSYGSSAIVDPDGTVVRCTRHLCEDLIVADLETNRESETKGP